MFQFVNERKDEKKLENIPDSKTLSGIEMRQKFNTILNTNEKGHARKGVYQVRILIYVFRKNTDDTFVIVRGGTRICLTCVHMDVDIICKRRS